MIPRWVGRDILLPYLLTRVVLCFLAWLSLHFLHLRTDFPDAWEIGAAGHRQVLADHQVSTANAFVNMWSRWDAEWYLQIAKNGYDYAPGRVSNTAFFPLYPLLMRTTHAVFFLPQADYCWLLVGIGLSNIFLLGALIYLRLLVTIDYSEIVARHTILYLLVFPTTCFLSAVYSESLFLALSVAAFYYARRNHWNVAWVLLALSGLTRSLGLLLTIPLLLEYASERDFKLRKADWNLIGVILPLIATAAFVYYLKSRFGSWDILIAAQRSWSRHFTFPWDTLSWFILHARPLSLEHHDVLDFIFLVALILVAVGGCAILRFSYTAYLWTAILFFSGWGTLISVPRFFVVLFPAFIMLAWAGSANRLFHRTYLAGASLLGGIFMIMQTEWHWVA